MNSPSTFAQLKSIALLPFVVAVIIPFVVLCFLNEFTIVNEPGLWLKLIGVILFSIGFPLFIQSVVLFIKIGKMNKTRYEIV